MIIRKAELNDYAAINLLNCEEMGYEFPLEETKNKLEMLINNPASLILVALVEDKIVGYVQAHDYDCTYAPHMKNVMGLAVSKEYKRNGIGRSLMTEVEKWAQEDKAKIVRLVSGAKRGDAHLFYKNCGYDVSKQQINFKKEIDQKY